MAKRVEVDVLDTSQEAPTSAEMLRLAEELGRELSSTLDYDQAVRTAATCVVPRLADLAGLFVTRPDGTIRVEVAHRDPEREQPIRSLLLEAMDDLRLEASRTLQRPGRGWRWIPILSDFALHRLTNGNPTLERLVRKLEVHSLVLLPLRSGGQVRGALALGRSVQNHPFFAGEFTVLQVLAHRAAAAIDGAELRDRAGALPVRHSRLASALRKWTHVFKLAGWGAAVVDGEDRRIEAVNPAFARMHGYGDPDVLTGRLYADLLAPSQAGEPKEWNPQGLEDPHPYESVHVRADGTTFPTLTSVTPLPEAHGTPSFVVTVQDITTLKRTEDRLRRAQRMEAVGRLAGGVAHEVNNMMTIILGFADLLESAPEVATERKREVEEIRKAALRAGRITRQLLAFSRQQVLQPSVISLNEVVAEMVPVLGLMLPANVRVESVLAPVGGVVRADRAQLEQVLINLTFNARDAMPGGGVVRILTEFRHLDEEFGRRTVGVPIKPGRYGLLSVIDTGHGMDRETLAQAFEPFFTTKPVGQGTGLGLSTVYGIIKQSGGYIWAESSPGVGTTVTVSLPVVEETVAAKARRSSGRRRAQASGTVLVIDDEEGVRELGARVLRQQGYKVLEARSAAEALAQLGDPPGVDLIVTDVVLPDMGIAEFQLGAAKQHPGVRMLYMSGYPRDDLLARRLLEADQPFLQKPFTSEELADTVRELLASTPSPGSGR